MGLGHFSTRVHLPWLTFKFMFVNGLMLLAYHLISFKIRFYENWTDKGSLIITCGLAIIFLITFLLMRSAVNSTYGIFYNEQTVNFEYPLIFHKKIYPWSEFRGFSTSHSLSFNVIIFYLRSGEHIIVSQRSVWDFSQFRYHLGAMPIEYLGREPFRWTLSFPKVIVRKFQF